MNDPITVVGVDLLAIAPEVTLAIGGLFILLMGAILRTAHRAVLTAVALVFLGVSMIGALPNIGRTEFFFFDGTVVADGFSVFCKLLIALIAAIALVVSYAFLDAERPPSTEYIGLLLFCAAGMMLMAGSGDLILIFVSLETFSLALYVLAGYRRSRADSQEGALKYFLTGSFSSGFFLYGVALIYGATGTTRVSGLSTAVLDDALFAAGVALVIVGLGFKVSAVPFHMWTPDVYQGSPSPVAGFMAAGSKVAGFAALFRVTAAAFPVLAANWRPVVSGIAALTMIVGTVVAIAQTNVKRMLAYSSIAHSGFLLMGVAAANDRAVSGSLFYLAVYAFTILGSFAVVYAVGRPGEERVTLSDYKGLSAKQPFLAAILALLLVSLAGVPPTAGFWAKFEVFSAAAEAGQIPLVVLAVVASAAAAFFYLRLIVLMFLQDREEWVASKESTSTTTGAALVVVGLIILIVGVLPAPLLEFARASTLHLR